MVKRVIRFKADFWGWKDTEENTTEIHIGGLTEKNETVYCTVLGFTPFVYLELPSGGRWDKVKCQLVFEHFTRMMGDDHAPINYVLAKKYLLNYKEPVKVMTLTFPTLKSTKFFAGRLRKSRNIYIDKVGNFGPTDFHVHEHNIDTVMKFTAMNELNLAGWLEVKESIVAGEEKLSIERRKYSTAGIDLYADWKDVKAWKPKETIIVYPKYVSFDIECYSKNHNSKISDPEIPENEAFQIACIVGEIGKKDTRKYLFSRFNPHEMEDVKLYRFATERELLLAFAAFIRKHDPTVILGYNIMKFDWRYLVFRAKHCRVFEKFCKVSRIEGETAEFKEQSWSSSAYKEQNLEYINANGRVNLDVLIEVERNYRLASYSLNSVCEHLKLGQKEDLSARQLFMLYQLTVVMTPIFEKVAETRNLKSVLKHKLRIKYKKQIQLLMPLRQCGSPEVLQYRRKLLQSTLVSDFVEGIRGAMDLIGKYCVQDTILPIRILDKLNLWTAMEQTSNCMHVPMSYLHTRGQQIKVLAQVFRETIFDSIIIPSTEKKKGEKYQGATVIEANPSYEKNVLCTDFESLYPSMMIEYNICYTTLMRDNDPIKDSECNVIEWEEHKNCPHDSKGKAKPKKDEIRCTHHRYRFRKVVYLPNGERLHEGLMPKLERRLLSERKIIKKEMAKMEAKLKTATGTATDDEIAFYKKVGWEIVEPNTLTQQQLDILQVCVNVLNAQQLAMKISANSAYGAMGASTGFIPLIPGAASVTAKGRETIIKAIKYIVSSYPGDAEGRFKARLIYGDTDSAMITFGDITLAEAFDLGEKVTKAATHYLKCDFLKIDEGHTLRCPSEKKKYRLDQYPRVKLSELKDDDKVLLYSYDGCPVNLQFENLYQRYLLLTKKRYIAYCVNKKGDMTIIKKGVVLARRDNCEYVRICYKALVTSILDEKPETEFMLTLYEHVDRLFTRQVPDAHLIIYIGVSSIMGYAKKHTIKNTSDEVLSVKYIDHDGNFFEPTSALDPRLIYSNITQVLLALKMIRRGDQVPANTRLEFLFLENEDAQHQGDQAEDYTYYRENKSMLGLRPDRFLYLEKKLSKPVVELINVRYPRKLIADEKLEDALKRSFGELSSLYRVRILAIRAFSYTSDDAKFLTALIEAKVGWDAKCKKCKAEKKCRQHPRAKTTRDYHSKALDAQVMYVLDSMKKRKMGQPNEISEEKYDELKTLCLRWKSRTVINKIRQMHGLRKKPIKRAKHTGQKMIVRTKHAETKVMLATKIEGYPRLSVGTLKAIYIEDLDGSKAKAKEYFYDIEMAPIEGVSSTLKRVARRDFFPARENDGSIMKDILVARMAYANVVKQLNLLSSQVVFNDDVIDPEDYIASFEVPEAKK